MMFNVDKEQSLKAAKQFIYPVLILKYGNAAEILSIEEIESTLAQRLDSAGNDILVTADDVTTTINSRCHNWQGFLTFTIRKDRHGTLSEYDRIKKNMECGGIVPKFFAQCYSQGDYAKVGLIETIKLFNFIADNINNNKVGTRQNGNVGFLFVDWQHLKDSMETYAVKGKQISKLK